MDQIEEIKKRIDIVYYIGSSVNVKKSGRNVTGLCPFHQEKTPSFVVSPERQIWHCFGACGEGGDVVKFLMKWENLTFFEALKELAEKTGVKLEKVHFDDKAFNKKDRILKLNNLAADFYQYVLFKTEFGKKVLDYLEKRGINKKIAEKFHLGYAPKSWDSLSTFLKRKGFSFEEMMETGMAIKGQHGFYDRFRARMIFPIKNARGETIGFSGRVLENNPKEAKYINSPETPVYHKRESLFGIDVAKEAIKKGKNVYLVEGEFDMISPFVHGIENVVAIKGSAVTREQLMFLKRFTNRVTLMLDADNSGEEAIKRAIESAEDLDFELEVVTFDFAKDPDEAIRGDIEKFKKALKNKVSIYDFLIQRAQKLYPDNDAFSKKKTADFAIPFIEKIRNPIVQEHYVRKLASLLDISEESVWILIKKIRTDRKRRDLGKKTPAKTGDETREVSIQKYALSILFQSKDAYKLAEGLFSIISPEDFFIPSYQKIYEEFLKFKKEVKEFAVHKFGLKLPAELRPTFDEIYLYASYEVEFEDLNLEKILNEIRRFSLKRQITEKLKNESAKEQDKDLKDLSSKLKEVEKRLLVL